LETLLPNISKNDSEAINSAIKCFVKFKKSDWPTFNEKIKKFVSDQLEEVLKAIIGTGQYVLKEEYQHHAVTPYNWFTFFTTEQRECARRKFQKACVVEFGDCQVQHGLMFRVEGCQAPQNEDDESQRQQSDDRHRVQSEDGDKTESPNWK